MASEAIFWFDFPIIWDEHAAAYAPPVNYRIKLNITNGWGRAGNSSHLINLQ